MGKLIKTADLFDLTHSLAAPLLAGTVYPHEALPKIGDFIKTLIKGLSFLYNLKLIYIVDGLEQLKYLLLYL